MSEKWICKNSEECHALTCRHAKPHMKFVGCDMNCNFNGELRWKAIKPLPCSPIHEEVVGLEEALFEI